MLQIITDVIEKNITKPTTDNHTHGHIEEEIPDLLGGPGRTRYSGS